MNKTNRQFLTLIFFSLTILVIKAYVPLPILWRGIEGHGLYRIISIVQFFETGICTWLLITFFTMRYWRMNLAWGILLGISCALFNFGLMVLDARLQTFPDGIEIKILERYGTAEKIFALATLSIALGLSFAYIILAKLQRLTDHR